MQAQHWSLCTPMVSRVASSSLPPCTSVVMASKMSIAAIVSKLMTITIVT